jgi:hypothetical protein
MSKVNTLPGDGSDPRFPVHPLDSLSPRWRALRFDEKRAAAEGVSERPVMRVVMAIHTMARCLGDARRAADEEQCEALYERFRRVKASVFDGHWRSRSDDDIRTRLTPTLRSRLILLNADRGEATAAADAAVALLLALRRAGEVPPPRFGRYSPTRPPGERFAAFLTGKDERRVPVQRVWDEEGALLTRRLGLAVSKFLDDELRAFAVDPPPDEFLAAAGPGPVCEATMPNPTFLESPEEAERHAWGLIQSARMVVGFALRAYRGDEHFSPEELGEYAREYILELNTACYGRQPTEELLRNYRGQRREPFEFGTVVGSTVYEAVRELVWMAKLTVRGYMTLDPPVTSEVLSIGPWEGSEVATGLIRLAAERPDLCDAFNQLNVQRLTAALSLEASREISRQMSEGGENAGPTAPASRDPGPQMKSRGGPKPRYDAGDDALVARMAEKGLAIGVIAKARGTDEDSVRKAIKRHHQRPRDKARRSK